MNLRRIVFSICAILLFSVSVSYAEVEYARVQSVDLSTIVVERENGSLFELRLDRGCTTIWRYEGRTIEIEYYGKFMGPDTVVHLAKEREQCGIRTYTRLESPRPKPEPKPEPKPKFEEELVRLMLVRGNYVTVRRDSAAQYDLQIGPGCYDIARYRDRYIRATWTGSFLEYDGYLSLPNTDQQCRVRSSMRR